MPKKLPVISGKEAMKAFSHAGWQLDRIAGSHAIMRKEGSPVTLSVPLHSELRKGLLRALIKDAGIELEEFLAYLILLGLRCDCGILHSMPSQRLQAETAASPKAPAVLERAFRGEL